jgi:hypothetical protein
VNRSDKEAHGMSFHFTHRPDETPGVPRVAPAVHSSLSEPRRGPVESLECDPSSVRPAGRPDRQAAGDTPWQDAWMAG